MAFVRTALTRPTSLPCPSDSGSVMRRILTVLPASATQWPPRGAAATGRAVCEGVRPGGRKGRKTKAREAALPPAPRFLTLVVFLLDKALRVSGVRAATSLPVSCKLAGAMGAGDGLPVPGRSGPSVSSVGRSWLVARSPPMTTEA